MSRPNLGQVCNQTAQVIVAASQVCYESDPQPHPQLWPNSSSTSGPCAPHQRYPQLNNTEVPYTLTLVTHPPSLSLLTSLQTYDWGHTSRRSYFGQFLQGVYIADVHVQLITLQLQMVRNFFQTPME